jgi:hypothetical protein
VDADAVLRDPLQRVVDGVDADLGERAVVLDGSGVIWSQFSAMEGSSIWRMSPASTMALYSSFSASAQA